MKKIVLIDGLGDFSVTSNIYKYNIIDTYTLMLTYILHKQGEQVELYDMRLSGIPIGEIEQKMESDPPDYVIIRAKGSIHAKVSLIALPYCSKVIIWGTITQEYSAPFFRVTISEELKPIENIRNLLHLLGNDLADIPYDYNYNYFSVIKKSFLSPYGQIEIVTGSGCEKRCSFCNLSGSLELYYDVDEIIKQIKYLADNQTFVFFHVRNHNFTNNIYWLKDFTSKMVEIVENHSHISWSCYVSPGDLRNMDNGILCALGKANLKQIFIGVEHVDPQILKTFHLTFSDNKFIDDVKRLHKAGILSVVINYCIGSKQESGDTLMKLFAFSEQIIHATRKAVEFNFSFHVDKSNYNADIKSRCNLGTNYLNKPQLITAYKTFQRKVQDIMATNVLSWSIKYRIEFIKMCLHGAQSQYWLHYLSKSSARRICEGVMDCMGVYKYSYEINPEKLVDYAAFITIPYSFDLDGHVVIPVDPILNTIGKVVLSELDVELINYARSGISIREIVNKTTVPQWSRAKKEEYILSFYKMLEYNSALIFGKVI